MRICVVHSCCLLAALDKVDLRVVSQAEASVVDLGTAALSEGLRAVSDTVGSQHHSFKSET